MWHQKKQAGWLPSGNVLPFAIEHGPFSSLIYQAKNNGDFPWSRPWRFLFRPTAAAAGHYWSYCFCSNPTRKDRRYRCNLILLCFSGILLFFLCFFYLFGGLSLKVYHYLDPLQFFFSKGFQNMGPRVALALTPIIHPMWIVFITIDNPLWSTWRWFLDFQFPILPMDPAMQPSWIIWEVLKLSDPILGLIIDKLVQMIDLI